MLVPCCCHVFATHVSSVDIRACSLPAALPLHHRPSLPPRGVAMVPPNVFTHAEAVQLRDTHRIVGMKKAHQFLHELRTNLTDAQSGPDAEGVWGFTH